MKNLQVLAILLVLILPAAQRSYGNGPEPISDDGGPAGQSGVWSGSAPIWICGSSRVCAEWYEPGNDRHGTVCCIDELDIGKPSFNACVTLIRAPRTGGNDP